MVTVLIISQSPAASSDQRLPIEIDVGKPTAYWLAAGTTAPLPPEISGGLSHIPPANIGWFDYHFHVDQPGWYRLLIDAPSHIARTEFLFGGEQGDLTARLDRDTPLGGGRFEEGWIWLTQGTQRLRVQHLFWTGLPQIRRIQLEPAPTPQAAVFRLLPAPQTTFAIGACVPLQIESGGNQTTFTIDATFRRGTSVVTRKIVIPPSEAPTRSSLALPCDAAGDVRVDLRSSDSRIGVNIKARTDYVVFDSSPLEPTYVRGELALEIDAVTRKPDYASGETSVIKGDVGEYRISGANGSTPFIRYNARSLPRRLLTFDQRTKPDWFAYRVEGLAPNEPCIIEVEYPDDEARVFVVAFRDRSGRGYPTSIGVETDTVWPRSGSMRKTSAVAWPSSSDGRIIVFNIHNGMRAAISRIRVYKASLRQAPQVESRGPGRDVIFWNEEGDNFRDVVGQGHAPDAVFTPVDRYLSLARSSGATIVSPTVAIYNFAMYPSRFHLTFSDRERDMTAAFMLGAERYGLKVVPQLHPRADELIWPPRDKAALGKRLLLSGQGEHHFLRPDNDFFRPPFYNPLDADIRRWYVDMIGELADRYKDYPAFFGIDLRVSNWQNPTLNNLESLEWGYDADTVVRFFRDTGLELPSDLDLVSDQPAQVRQRHDYLVGKQRAAWVRWRCESLRDLYSDIVKRVRSARPNLRLFVSLFGERTWNVETMRDSGIDLDLLKPIEGLTIIDARYGHGARESELSWRRTQHDDLVSPNPLLPSDSTNYRPSILFPMEYIEITGEVAPSKAIGLPAPPREPWISSTTEPPGRLALSRFAAAVGLTDALAVGDGGNGYVFGNDQATLSAFMKEFRSLPPRPFDRLPDVPDAIIVRQSNDVFYVVNMLGLDISAQLRLSEPGTVKRKASGDALVAANGILSLDLQPYEMRAFTSEGNVRVIGAQVSLSKKAETDFLSRANLVRQSASRTCGSLFKGGACTELRTKSAAIDAAIGRKAYWTAERLLETDK